MLCIGVMLRVRTSMVYRCPRQPQRASGLLEVQVCSPQLQSSLELGLSSQVGVLAQPHKLIQNINVEQRPSFIMPVPISLSYPQFNSLLMRRLHLLSGKI